MFSKRQALLLIGILLPFAPAAVAQKVDRAEIQILPRDPTPNDVISAQLSGMWHNGCVPRSPQVSTTKQAVRIQLQFDTGICTAALTRWSLTASIGRLPAGDYRVSVVRGAKTSAVTMGQGSFSVKAKRR
jgi:hypothetical protein